MKLRLEAWRLERRFKKIRDLIDWYAKTPEAAAELAVEQWDIAKRLKEIYAKLRRAGK